MAGAFARFLGSIMKTYEVEFRRESFIVYTVEAESLEAAEAAAWLELESSGDDSDSASWDVESIEEVKK